MVAQRRHEGSVCPLHPRRVCSGRCVTTAFPSTGSDVVIGWSDGTEENTHIGDYFLSAQVQRQTLPFATLPSLLAYKPTSRSSTCYRSGGVHQHRGQQAGGTRHPLSYPTHPSPSLDLNDPLPHPSTGVSRRPLFAQLVNARVIRKNGQTALAFERKCTPADSVQLLEGVRQTPPPPRHTCRTGPAINQPTRNTRTSRRCTSFTPTENCPTPMIRATFRITLLLSCAPPSICACIQVFTVMTPRRSYHRFRRSDEVEFIPIAVELADIDKGTTFTPARLATSHSHPTHGTAS